MRVSAEEKLAAILVADVPDYERLIVRDRPATEAALQLQHHEIIDAAIAIYGGRIFELEADHTLAEFSDPLAAVSCAVEMQQRLESRAAGVPSSERIRLRIGLHYGEALVERGDLTGEALAIAKRVHAAARAGEICISRTVFESVRKRVKHGFVDLATLPDRPVPKAGLAFRLDAAPETLQPRVPEWLGTVGRLALTAVVAAAAIWLAINQGGPG
jgi:class 3 adenylate cyclase